MTWIVLHFLQKDFIFYHYWWWLQRSIVINIDLFQFVGFTFPSQMHVLVYPARPDSVGWMEWWKHSKWPKHLMILIQCCSACHFMLSFMLCCPFVKMPPARCAWFSYVLTILVFWFFMFLNGVFWFLYLFPFSDHTLVQWFGFVTTFCIKLRLWILYFLLLMYYYIFVQPSCPPQLTLDH